MESNDLLKLLNEQDVRGALKSLGGLLCLSAALYNAKKGRFEKSIRWLIPGVMLMVEGMGDTIMYEISVLNEDIKYVKQIGAQANYGVNDVARHQAETQQELEQLKDEVKSLKERLEELKNKKTKRAKATGKSVKVKKEKDKNE